VQQQKKPMPMPFVESTSDAVSRGASTEKEYRLSESADAAFVENYGVENSFSTAAYDMVTKFSQNVVNARTIDGIPDGELKDRQVSTALNKMRRDVISLDALASSRSQLTSVELLVLTSTVLISASAPWLLPVKLVELIVPSMAALSAAIGLSAEYVGKTAVSRGKEVAAVTLQAAAESEAVLAQAERAKAVVPLCVGLSATASAFALLAPELVAELGTKLGLQIVTEVYLICPLLAAIAAAVASLATAECAELASAAAGLGARRFATSGQISRTWLSATEQIGRSSEKTTIKWRSFAGSVLLAPALAVLTPGILSFKAIVAAAAAAAQTAFFLAKAEYAIALGADAVALKSRQAAVSDTYANQGARAGAILPFTSATASLCAAVTVAVVELLPIIPSVLAQSAAVAVFPLCGSFVAAAATISKARCEVDAEAATAAANELSRTDREAEINPLESTFELIKLSNRALLDRLYLLPYFGKFLKRFLSPIFAARRRDVQARGAIGNGKPAPKVALAR